MEGEKLVYQERNANIRGVLESCANLEPCRKANICSSAKVLQDTECWPELKVSVLY